MKTRVVSAIIALLIFVPIVVVGGSLFTFTIYLLSLLGLKELIDIKITKKEMPELIKFILFILMTLIMFNNKNVYEIETALAIYEFMDKDINSISDAEIFRVYDLIHSQDEIFDDYVKEEIQRIKEDHDKEERIKEDISKKEKDIQKEKEQDSFEK